MRRLTLLAVLLAPAVLLAQEDRFLVHVSHVVVPQTRSFRITPRAEPVEITGVRARVSILEQAATTTLEVSLGNPGGVQAEAILLLPVPDGAAVSGFDFQGSASEPTARILPREEARRTYDSIVRKVRDPALLEFAGYNLVRSSVFPVPARGTQRIRLTYHHILEADGNRVDYVLPRSESLDTDIPWDVSVEIQAKTPVATVYSPSHELVVQRHEGHSLTVRGKEKGRMEPGPFRLSYLLERNGLSGSLFSYPDPRAGGGYFLLLAGLPSRVKGVQVKREVTLVLDRSGSMAGGNLDQVRAAALQIIEGLDPGEAFNIIDYSTAVALFAPMPVERTDESVAKARAYLTGLRPVGGTNIHDALVEALRQEPVEGRLPLVLFLTDGLPTIGNTSEVAIRELVEKHNTHHRRVFTFGVGHDVNVPLLDRIAEVSRAASTYVLPDEDVEVKVAQVFRRLYGPVLAGGRLETLDGENEVTTQRVRDLIPATLPDLFEGDQLVVLGQYKGSEPLRFRLAGSYLGKPHEFRLEFDLDRSTTRNAFVPRLWATRRIGFLVDQIRQAGAAAGGRPALVGETIFNDPRFRELRDEILRLSTEFGILSEYTAFLAREGTNLADFEVLARACGTNIDELAVKKRWGQEAVAQGKNFAAWKNQSIQDRRSLYFNSKLERTQTANVLQVCDKTLFKQGNRYIEGGIVAQKITLEPDRIVAYGSAEFTTYFDRLVTENRQGLVARKGDVLLRVQGENVLFKMDIK